MGIRFRRRIKLAPGVHLNASGSGLSVSAGPRGASMTFGGRRGTYMNMGVPGTGLYARERVGVGSLHGASGGRERGSAEMSVSVSVEDDGTVIFKDADGNPLSEQLVKQTKEQGKDEIRTLLQTACDEINERISSLEEIHLSTPSPFEPPMYTSIPFQSPKPVDPVTVRYGLLAKLFKSKRKEVDELNEKSRSAYQCELESWTERLREHNARERVRKALFEEKVHFDLAAMEIVLEDTLMDIVWPRETLLSSEIRDDGSLVMIDVDLPEIENLPSKTATVPSRGYKLSIKELSATRQQQLYMRHVHGIAFRIIGEVFCILPKVEEVVLSGYTQRPDASTGEIQDQYLYSVSVKRDEWSGINFACLKDVDPTEALGRFAIRREVSKAGKFRAIEPYMCGANAS
ncbi:DUF4236 domain-containing protein [Denitromonas ohlonensis]|uniref:DUF4236 domain-containing protein n=2 Tax=Denitromonas TaxID=139331 RepID=A0A557R2X9_9RHOO|nr:DUF4236 domain-containing protein [Denitromonas ohlonensis]TVO59520.1 DUF4236 domain-containing protein [Denitromonas ohlonensis]TVO76343.1 DUF4236 domain-containing protein [Denitromonas ohlonensis]